MNAQERPTDFGINRTGLALSPLDGQATVEGAKEGGPQPPGSDAAIAQVRRDYIEESGSIGGLPPPVSLRGLAGEAIGRLQGKRPGVLLDKLGERLAFERGGVRLYEGLITKLQAAGTWDGGPELADLERFRDDEAAHFEMIREEIERLGGDPTALTPSADLVGVEAAGIMKVVQDPRTTLAQALHAHLLAELADVAAWAELCELEESLGADDVAKRFRKAHDQELVHRESVRRWLKHHTELAARGERDAAE